MNDTSLLMMASASGVVFGALLHFATPTDIVVSGSKSWRDSIPHHPDTAAMVSRDVNAEFVAFDYYNARDANGPVIEEVLVTTPARDLPRFAATPSLARAPVEPALLGTADTTTQDRMAFANLESGAARFDDEEDVTPVSLALHDDGMVSANPSE
jgi:hypothetical protein